MNHFYIQYLPRSIYRQWSLVSVDSNPLHDLGTVSTGQQVCLCRLVHSQDEYI